MHPEVRHFVSQFCTPENRSIVEIGSRNINGSVRDLFCGAHYTGIDLQPGPDVDIVADGETWTPPEPVDLVLCLEVLEHARNWRELIQSAGKMLKVGGRFIMTCAAGERVPHSAVDGGSLRQDEYYRNLGMEDVLPVLAESGLALRRLEQDGQDLRVMAVRRPFQPAIQSQ